MSFVSRSVLSAFVTLAMGFGAWSQPAAQQHVSGCALEFQDHYRCDGIAFQQRLSAARTIRVDTDRLDLFAAKRTQDLVQSLGKTVTAPEQRPDLIFDLSPVDRSGRVDLSPANVALATLSVYDPTRGTGKRSLIWVETLDGSTDRPWPGVVIGLLDKFKKDALTH